MTSRSGRPGCGAARYRRNRAAVLRDSDMCALCGHPGARSTDHIITPENWPRGPDGKMLPGFDDPSNLQPAHGTMGNTGYVNRCPICKRVCNQSRKNKPLPTGRRPW